LGTETSLGKVTVDPRDKCMLENTKTSLTAEINQQGPNVSDVQHCCPGAVNSVHFLPCCTHHIHILRRGAYRTCHVSFQLDGQGVWATSKCPRSGCFANKTDMQSSLRPMPISQLLCCLHDKPRDDASLTRKKGRMQSSRQNILVSS
jgi:hypothetical protein